MKPPSATDVPAPAVLSSPATPLGPATPAGLLEQDARGLLTRLARVKPFALNMPMVVAAAVSPAAQRSIEAFLDRGRRDLRRMVHRYLAWLRSPAGRAASPAAAQARFTFLRLRFNAVLSQFDTFAEVMTQRSQHEFGVWLSGLDAVAADALALPGGYYDPPPVICYLVRGFGAAIRRARTRLPGGGETPVAIVRVPRERMVGSGVASSLVHEVGHQAASLLGLVESLRPLLRGLQRTDGPEREGWVLWDRWISEIVADFWSLARVGVTATTGLIGVVGLPRPFVFRINADDPHPFPWIRVVLSCAMGAALFPHPQWRRLSKAWRAFYPPEPSNPERRRVISALLATMPALVALLANHRPAALRGRSLVEALGTDRRQPARLAALFRRWSADPDAMRRAPPSLVFAVVGQARADGQISPERESRLLADLLDHWALVSTFAPTRDPVPGGGRRHDPSESGGTTPSDGGGNGGCPGCRGRAGGGGCPRCRRCRVGLGTASGLAVPA